MKIVGVDDARAIRLLEGSEGASALGVVDAPGALNRFATAVRSCTAAADVAVALRTAVAGSALARMGEADVYLLDDLGHLRVDPPSASARLEGRRWSETRRQALAAGASVLATDRDGRSRAFVPLVEHGRTFGLLEAAGPSDLIERALALLEIMGSVAAAACAELEGPEASGEASDLALAWTAHELKGPLEAIRLALERVLEMPEIHDARELLERSATEASRLSTQVHEILRWAVGREPLRRRRVDLVRVVRDAVEAGSVDPERSGHELTVTVTGPVSLEATVDPVELGSAISNLIRNAVTHARSRVDLTIDRSPDRATVRVRDDGPGVPNAERAAIFDPFVRGSSARATAGSGLGLFIARRAVHEHGGTLEMAPMGSGAEFVVDLPISGAP